MASGRGVGAGDSVARTVGIKEKAVWFVVDAGKRAVSDQVTGRSQSAVEHEGAGVRRENDGLMKQGEDGVGRGVADAGFRREMSGEGEFAVGGGAVRQKSKKC